MAMVVPVTSRTAALRFPYTLRVEPSPTNGLTSASVLLVFQLRAVDVSRVIDVMGHLEETYLRQLDELLRKMLAL
jgi:mRNA interferase MazF